jgi:DNA-binding NarL/FixJ family response regulator
VSRQPPTAPDDVVTVALVDDEAAMRDRLSGLIAMAPRTELVFATDTAQGMIDWLGGHSVYVLLVDLGLPDRPGLDVIRHCRRTNPGTEIMVISMFGDEASMVTAFEAGARGYLLKDGTEDDLARHIVNLYAGGSPMTPLIARRLLERLQPPKPGAAPQPGRDAGTITAREQEILSLLSRGYTYAEVAALLGLAPSTIQSHVKNIYSKLCVHSRAEAVFEARQLGLL